MPMRTNDSMNFRTLLFSFGLVVLAAGCKKEYDTPPERILPTGSVLTVAQLRGLYTGTTKKFVGDSSVYAVVTADEQSGNLYKNIYVQDQTGAIVMRLLNSGGLYQGDSIRIYLTGTVLSAYAGMLQLDSVDVDNNIIKQATLVNVVPRTITVSQATPELQGYLVRMENVQFIAPDTALTYADPIAQSTLNRTLENCNGNAVLVRTSGYSNFAGTRIPNGKGTFVGVLSQFQSDMQLYIRNINEVQMTGSRCGEAACVPAINVNEGFGSVANGVDVLLDCWLNVLTTGSRKWKGTEAGSELYASVAPPSFNATSEAWLISPPVVFSPGMSLAFSSAIGGTWQHDGLSIQVTTDINLQNGTDVSNATWISITGVPLAGSSTAVGAWVTSGAIALDSYLTAGVPFVIGFKYNSSPGQVTPYRLDNVLIQ